MLVIADINTIWRRKPFEALSEHQSVLCLAPRRWGDSTFVSASAHRDFHIVPISLPPGWASHFTKLSALWMWSRAKRCAASREEKISGLVVTSPHYTALAKRASSSVPVFYYGSDDYSQYNGWGGESILRKEAEIVRLATHSFFVSGVLAKHTEQDYHADPSRITVSANATEERFVIRSSEAAIQELFLNNPGLKRPLVGVVGAINSRIDFELLEQCLTIPEIGTLLLIGSCDPNENEPALEKLRQHAKCLFLGPISHENLPLWMQSLDVALIPYRDTALNRACSPMRLYDHLAAGRTIVATSVNEQITQMKPLVRCGTNASEFIGHLQDALRETRSPEITERMRQVATHNLWATRATTIHEILNRYTSSATPNSTRSV
jgi:hypothetical protein